MRWLRKQTEVADLKRDERYVLALEQARRNLDRQADSLKEIRARATTLLGVAGLATTLIGGLALRDEGELRWTSSLALLAFAIVAVLVLIITYPRPFTFDYSAWVILGWIEENTADYGSMTRQLTVDLQQAFWKNQRSLVTMTRLYSAAVPTLIVEGILLFLDLRGR